MSTVSLTQFGEAILEPSPGIIDSERNIQLPDAWLVRGSVSSAGTNGGYYCGQEEPFPCPDDLSRECFNSHLFREPLVHTRLPDRTDFTTRIEVPAGSDLQLLTNTAEVEFFAATIQEWTDETSSLFGPDARKLTGKINREPNATWFLFEDLPLEAGIEYLLSARIEFSAKNERTYLWTVSGT